MRRLWVALTVVLLLGWVCTGTFSGRLSGTIRFDPDPATTFVSNLFGFLDIDYVLGPVTFGATPIFRSALPTSPAFMFAEAFGRIGSLAFASQLTFDFLQGGAHHGAAAAWLELGSAELWGFLFLNRHDVSHGLGFSVGASGTSSGMVVAAEAGFNAQNGLSIFDATSGRIFPYVRKAHWDALNSPSTFTFKPGASNPFQMNSCVGEWFFIGFEVQTAGCCAALSSVDISFFYPFCCLDVGMDLRFTCEEGLRSITFTALGVEIPAWPWLTVSELNLTFEPGRLTGKWFDWWCGLNLGEFACITPFFRMGDGLRNGIAPRPNATPFTLGSIAMVAMFLECSFGDATFRAGSELEEGAVCFDRRGLPRVAYGRDNFYPHTAPPLYENCGWPPNRYDEFFGLIAGSDACCGGAYGLSVFFWFDHITHAMAPQPSGLLFDLTEVDIDLSFGLTENVTIRTGLEFTEANLIEELLLGLDIAF